MPDTKGTRIGRPTKDAAPGTRVGLGLRVTAKLKKALEAHARHSGRTQSQEAEARLERTFRDDEILAALDRIGARLDQLATPSKEQR